MILNDETPDFDTVESIQFQGEDSYQVTYQEYTEDSPYTYCADDVYFRQDGENLLALDTSNVKSYLNTISNLDLTDYVTYNATEEELAGYGLDNPELTVTVQYTPEEESSSQTFVLSVSRDPEERASSQEQSEEETDEDTEEEITAYVRVGESKIVYQITSSEYEALMAAGYDDLRHDEVLTADFDQVTGLDISLDGAEYSITSKGSGDKKTFLYNEEELEIEDLQSALEGLTASSFTDEEPTQKEEIFLTVHLDNETHPQVEIAFYRYDGEQCLAVVNGQSVSLVPRSSVVDLVEAINAIVL